MRIITAYVTLSLHLFSSKFALLLIFKFWKLFWIFFAFARLEYENFWTFKCLPFNFEMSISAFWKIRDFSPAFWKVKWSTWITNLLCILWIFKPQFLNLKSLNLWIFKPQRNCSKILFFNYHRKKHSELLFSKQFSSKILYWLNF